MFTGIVELGKIQNVLPNNEGWGLAVHLPNLVNKVQLGSSVAIDGACLSVTKIEEDVLHFFVSTESINKTIIKNYSAQALVNVELPMQVGGYLGGHYVLGHVDAVGKVAHVQITETAWFVNIKIPNEFKKYIVYKGSITINGISLTVNKVEEDIVSLCVIPITLEKTNVSTFKKDTEVNVEFDILAKYTEKLLNKKDE
jgi:riboflavin synthase